MFDHRSVYRTSPCRRRGEADVAANNKNFGGVLIQGRQGLAEKTPREEGGGFTGARPFDLQGSGLLHFFRCYSQRTDPHLRTRLLHFVAPHDTGEKPDPRKPRGAGTRKFKTTPKAAPPAVRPIWRSILKSPTQTPVCKCICTWPPSG